MILPFIALIMAAAAGSNCTLPPNQQPAYDFSISVKANVNATKQYNVQSLRLLRMSRVRLSQTFDGGVITGNFEGPALIELLTQAGVQKPRDEGGALKLIIRATATDGYSVVLSFAEVDPSITPAPAVIAIACNGEAISPTLLLPFDKVSARYVHELSSIEVLTVR